MAGGGLVGGGHQLDAAIRGVLAVLPAGGARTTPTPFARMGGLTWCEVTVSKGGGGAHSVGGCRAGGVGDGGKYRGADTHPGKIDSWVTFLQSNCGPAGQNRLLTHLFFGENRTNRQFNSDETNSTPYRARRYQGRGTAGSWR
jgi:hypothetical protein